MELKVLDLCTGMGGFHHAGIDNPFVTTVCTAEIDSFCKKHIDQNLGLENVGDLTSINTPIAQHPFAEMVEADLVPVEETGLTSITMEEINEGIVEINCITAGSPCQQVSPLNTLHNSEGINGKDSGLIHEVLDHVEDLDVDYFILENHALLRKRGMVHILERLSSLDYIIEYETVTGTAVGFPHYRHRLYLAAYKPTTPIARSGRRAFDVLRRIAQKAKPNDNFPLPSEISKDELYKIAVVENPKSIKLRTKRLNAVGNTVIPLIPKAIFKGLTNAFSSKVDRTPKPRPKERYIASFTSDGLRPEQMDLFNDNGLLEEVPSHGYMINGELFSGDRDYNLNPQNTTYKNLYSTAHCRDGNNNFSPSRLRRPGKMGGLVSDVMKAVGATAGGLNPTFSEQLLGYPADFTKLPDNKAY
ncbi:DNA cytosine methyltransferase [Vibrio owensii]|uniref:DNA cytosine methyltransferase n=1 Tax=Vibrio owensii TaxID=696485 RepID=UPI0018F1EB06|nr:DNA cytosine methyltransferase [Vibrio owensii]